MSQLSYTVDDFFVISNQQERDEEKATAVSSLLLPISKQISSGNNTGYLSQSPGGSRPSSPTLQGAAAAPALVPITHFGSDGSLASSQQQQLESTGSVHSASSATAPSVISVMNENKTKMLRIPMALIDPTNGLKKYMSDPKKNSTMNAFKFHLCTEHRKETGGCPYKGECFFIHSRHTLDDALAAQVEESPVHVCVDLKSYAEAPYPTHKYDDEGKGSTNIVVFDHSIGQHMVMEAGCAFITKGSSFALQESLKSPNGALVIRQVVSEKLRVCFCTHYDRGWCARGDTCLYVHRVKVNGSFLHTLHGGSNAAGAVVVGDATPPPQPQLVPIVASASPPPTMVIPAAAPPMQFGTVPMGFTGFVSPQPQAPQPQQQFMHVFAPMQPQPQPQPQQQQQFIQMPQQGMIFQPQQQQLLQQQQPQYAQILYPAQQQQVQPQFKPMMCPVAPQSPHYVQMQQQQPFYPNHVPGYNAVFFQQQGGSTAVSTPGSNILLPPSATTVANPFMTVHQPR